MVSKIIIINICQALGLFLILTPIPALFNFIPILGPFLGNCIGFFLLVAVNLVLINNLEPGCNPATCDFDHFLSLALVSTYRDISIVYHFRNDHFCICLLYEKLLKDMI